MPKRFTATEKWNDPWYRGLPPAHKLAWLYLCDNCDLAGIVDLDRELANFQIRDTLDWDAFIEAADGRITQLDCGKLWLTGFVPFQYGPLSEKSKLHLAVFKILDKYSLRKRLSKGLAVGINTHQDKDKDKDKDKEIRKGDARGKPKRGDIAAADIPIPEALETPGVRQAIDDWLAYKIKRGEAYRDAAYLGRKVAEFKQAGPAAFIAAVDSSIGSNYAGLFPAKGNTNGVPSGKRYPSGRYRA